MRDHGRFVARVGATIRGYRLERLLGVGGTAAVYEARRIDDGASFALKVLHPEHVDHHELRDALSTELALSQKLAHHRCVEVHELLDTEDGGLALVMELLHGESLERRWRRRGRIGPREALRIADAVLDLMVACHAEGIVHGDLKPANVFLAEGDEIKVLDFGIGHAARRSERRIAIGTPAFMAPEQARGDAPDAAADVFAVGALLWSILSGHLLRSGRSDTDVLHLATHDPPRSLSLVAPELPRSVVTIVDRALSVDAGARWPSAAEMQRAVRRAQSALDDAAIVESSGEDDSLRDSGRITLAEIPRARSELPPRG